jgi:nucleoside 2-deoxyribosyltransferase
MYIYIATKFDQKPLAEFVGYRLQTLGHKVTSRWHSFKEDNDMQAAAIRDLEDIDAADAVLVIDWDIKNGCGMWVEMGYALGKGKKVFILRSSGRGVFHFLPQVTAIDNVEDIK